MARLAEAFAQGGTITAEESASMELRREVAEAMEVLAAIDKTLEAVERGEEAGGDVVRPGKSGAARQRACAAFRVHATGRRGAGRTPGARR